MVHFRALALQLPFIWIGSCCLIAFPALSFLSTTLREVKRGISPRNTKVDRREIGAAEIKDTRESAGFV